MMEVKRFLEKNYGFNVDEINILEGYANINYKVKNASGSLFVLKEYTNNQPLFNTLQAETRVLMKLNNKLRDKFPKPVANLSGNFLTVSDDNLKKVYRLLKWVVGDFFYQTEHTHQLFSSFGKFLAMMDMELLQINDETIEARRMDWDLQYLTEIDARKDYIDDPNLRKYIDHFFLQFRENVLPVLPILRKSVIHNDANDWNVLVKNGKVTGLIDFGDMVYAHLIQELAVAITYAIFDKEDPLEWAALIVKSYNQVIQLKQEEVDILYYLIAGRLCMSLINSSKAKEENPSNDYISVSEKQAIALLKKWVQINPEKAKTVFRKAVGLKPLKIESVSSSIIKRHRFISPAQSVSYNLPVKMAGAAFQYMYDAYGNTFLDAYNNIPHVGHQHPRVVEAGQRQMARLNTNTRYIFDILAEYSEKLLSKFPEPLNKVFFVNSGSAASDLAIRLAQTKTGFKNVMVLEHGYHGHTRQGIEISHYKFGRKGGKGQAGYILKTPIPDTFRGPYKKNDGTAGRQYAGLAKDLLKEGSAPVAAFIAEPIVGCAGQVPLAKGYLKNVYPVIREQGGVCISDEVQTGFGRMGSTFWGFELQDVVPDIVVLGKPMGNGHPLAAVVTTDEIADSFDNGMEFFSSFGGNPVSCAIGKAVLEVIEEEGLQQNALETGHYFLKMLNELKNRYEVIGDVRGNGLFLGVELIKNIEILEHHTQLANHLKNKMRDNFILISTDGPKDNIIKMKPPMCFNKQNADIVVDRLSKLLTSYHT